MKMNGKVTRVENVIVDVDPSEILLKIKRALNFHQHDFVNGDNYHEYSYTHPHNGDDIYEKREATEDEKDNWKTYQKIKEIFQ